MLNMLFVREKREGREKRQTL